MAVQLNAVLGGLAEIAPLHLAASWDNVGLLIEPVAGRCDVEAGLLTIDLNERVLAEAITKGANLVISYHPIVFSGAKRLFSKIHRMLLSAIQKGVTVYLPIRHSTPLWVA